MLQTPIKHPHGVTCQVAAGDDNKKSKFARKVKTMASEAESSQDVEAGTAQQSGLRSFGTSAFASRTSSHSVVDFEFADLLTVAAVNNSAAYDATDRNIVIGDASVRHHLEKASGRWGNLAVGLQE